MQQLSPFFFLEGVSITDETPINNTDENSIKEIAGFLFGRRDIYSSAEEITRENSNRTEYGWLLQWLL